ncbi:hypothetical protein V8E53_010930 [Lactarius tabidus]
MAHQVHLRLDSVLQLLSHNGYSVFSLIDDILARGDSEWEDERIKLLKEGIERDAVDICARLLSHKPASSSISQWALRLAQSTLRSEVEEMPRRGQDLRNVISPYSSSGTTWASTNGPEGVFGTALLINYGHKATVNNIPDNVLLEIFSFYLYDTDPDRDSYFRDTRKWQTWRILAHICQRWRRIIFSSPRRLNLHIICTPGTPVGKNLAFWPVVLPIILDYYPKPFCGSGSLDPDDEDNIIFVLEHARRVRRIEILEVSTGALIEQVFTVMQRSFPVLTDLDLRWTTVDSDFSTPFPIIPRRFLGGFSPRLQYLRFQLFSFPEFPTFLWSARNLTTLKLKDIYHIGHISPEAMVRGLAGLTGLRYLSISFCDETPSSRQWISHPAPPMRAILPALFHFHYRGCGKYLEDLLAQIYTPRLKHVSIKYLTQPAQVLQLSQLINRTENLKIDQFRRAMVTFCFDYIRFELDFSRGERRKAQLSLKFLGFEQLHVQVPRLVQVLSQLVAVFSKVDHLIVSGFYITSRDMDLTEWLPFFRLFPAVEALNLCQGVAAYITSALEDTADIENSEMATDVFPALYLMWLEMNDSDDEDNDAEDRDKPVGSMERFLSLRQRSGHPVTVVTTEDEFNEADRNPL